MNSLALLLAAGLAGDINPCFNVVKPSPCERALAEKLYVEKERCAIKLAERNKEIVRLREIALQPPPEKAKSLSLFGLPSWVTPVTGALLFAGGIMLGASL